MTGCVRYENQGKTAYFNGKKYTRDDSTGYYLNGTTSKRIHRDMWEYFNGEIPEGVHIHHKDKDKSRNVIENLVAMEKGSHLSLHGRDRAKEDKEWLKQFWVAGVEAAKEWHKSGEGIEWHKQHYQNVKHKMHVTGEFVCDNCGKGFVKINTSNNRFCSNKCKSAWRRKAGIDDEKRECGFCGQEFTTNKYAKTKTCSGSCANRDRARRPQLRTG